MDVGSVTENSLMSGKDGGRDMANIVYILYLVGFILFPAAIVGVILAYTNIKYAKEPYKSHMIYQKDMFMKGLIFQGVIVTLYLVTTAIAAFTLGLGSVAYIVPSIIGVWWFVWTLIRIIQGMQALGRGENVG